MKSSNIYFIATVGANACLFNLFEEMDSTSMYVINRHGDREAVYFDKILNRIKTLAFGLHPLIDPVKVSQAVINGMFCGITTSELDNLAAQTCAYMAATHPDFSKLAARISVSNLHKNTEDDFAHVVHKLHYYQDKQGNHLSLISKDVFEFVQENAATFNSVIDYQRDLEFDYFAFKTLERSYLLRMNNRVVERPQQMFLRVACGIHCGNVERTIETYQLMSQKFFTHATPTLFYSGTPRPQMSSCFLIQMESDSIAGIFDTLKSCALISKSAGGIGLAVHKIRATGTYISGTNGRSNGLVPMLRVFNDTARYVDQGGGKRKGSFAVYLEPWHADIFEFLDLRKNHGKEELRARDLFYALWMNDLFMERVNSDGDWTLMCPHISPGLAEVYGDEFKALYEKYEKEGRGVRTVKAQSLWFAILQAQIETGNPFIVYKDSCNRKSNQKHLGTIQCSNLCTEIVEYTAPDEIAVCNLASIALPKFVDKEKQEFDFENLRKVAKIVTRNLNNVIDRNYYPTESTRKSNMRHRPVGIGIQGLADTFMLLRYPFESEQSLQLNREIFETIYYAALEASCELAAELGVYETYEGSPASKGLLQFDLWNEELKAKNKPPVQLSDRLDWAGLRAKIAKHGLRNSLLVAPMPTASTSQILGNCESFEPYTSNIYTRRVLSGEFFVVNPHLLADLIKLNLWDDRLKQKLIAANGSVQGIPEIPDVIKAIYKTTWEIKQRALIDLAAARGPFIDQSQSLNLYVTAPTYAKLSSMHFYAWKQGLKTGMYYLRTTSAVDAIKFTVDHATVAAAAAKPNQGLTSDNLGSQSMASSATSAQAVPSFNKTLEKTTSDQPLTTAGDENAAPILNPPSIITTTDGVCPLRPRNRVGDADDEPCLACSG